ncbi:MAG: hypothetical protein DRP78_00400 [Candidatus Omnitrophota bacterium]|nr:MAG: hypothetical protein DRP78_00400 [Candidatus Omnitrophota bacterium]
MKHLHQEELLKKIVAHPSLKEEIKTLTAITGNALWVIIPPAGKKYFICNNCLFKEKPQTQHCIDNINLLITESKKKNIFKNVIYANKVYTYCLPIIKNDLVVLYLGICNLKAKISPAVLDIINVFTRATVENVIKEFELLNLYETIKPRTVALSTVHTINRIVSSTFALDELLPRIARLALQVLCAQKCTIMLLDKHKRFLVPRAVVDLKKKSATQQPLKIGQGIHGKVVKTGKVFFMVEYVCIPLVSEGNVIGSISVAQRLNNKPFSHFDLEILTTLSEQGVTAIKNAQLYDEQEQLTLNAIKALASILSSGAYNYGRTNLFINVVMSIGMELTLTSDQMRCLYYAALLHNVSQISLPEKLLKKSTRLTGKDYKIIREHSRVGAKIIEPMGDRLKDVLPVIIYHHERYDGHGYPCGLKGSDIPLGARILSVSDAFDAMLSQRPYRKKLTISQAVAEIVRYSGEQFDPVIVDAFVQAVKRSKNKIFQKGKSLWVWKF